MNPETKVKMLEQLKTAYPSLAQVATAYASVYPFESTSPEVIDAVTVSVSLRLFMLMAAYIGVEIAPPEGAGENDELHGLAASVAP